MSSLAPGTTLQGTSWNYRILNPVVGDSTHSSTVYTAEVIPHENARHAPQAPKSALIKASPPGAVTALENMKRERQVYRLPGVTSSACFRKMYDEIDSSTIALEWLDTTLAEVKYQSSMRIYSLIVTVMRAALTSCVVLEGYGCVNMGTKFLS
ncbi:hypothetical protein AtubIFM55763_008434 [Aspergillus tubingensis]|uniref:Uncharacterized protein n=1 Tax=Aspergillus tubingensis TaxID=5068 RepID=A0A9W6AXH6_ASPTU|nr:hypothetical protein AtubIFM54640_002690 [Aspergillus tubingensis]GLA69251.1 hypothetical protein AtubIFM55763_008434 [Aspergillus tubingensis]GLA87740.1 hypothetical protein AtubIFM56815_002171 [Aspergillus tubingensis]GLA98590.1 hypothetical protein AtubIFM57143_006885 [Aspergillus tubingensis]GLB13347.1 hypothetical protein AtubIFM61612_000753 [Aspergillus tubingensis]